MNGELRTMRRSWVFVLFGLAGLGLAWVLQSVGVVPGMQPDGSVWVPTHQRLTPVGKTFELQTTRPKELAVGRDGRIGALCSGRVLVLSPAGKVEGDVALSTAPLGIVWSPDGHTLFVSAGDGKVARIAEIEGKWARAGDWAVDVPSGFQPVGRAGGNPQSNGLAVSGGLLYAALGIRNAVVEVDAATGDVRRAIATGIAPYHLSISSDGRTLAVSNRGGAAPTEGEPSALSAGSPVRVDPVTDAANGGSVSLVDTANWTVRHVPVGRQPSGTAFSVDGRSLFVANSDSDSVSIVPLDPTKPVQTTSLQSSNDPGFGLMPTDVNPDPDGRTLYVACGGLNAVLVADVGQGLTVRGSLPTAWYPVSMVQQGGTLWVACTKGIGSRREARKGRWGPHDSVGVIQAIAPDDRRKLSALTAQVLDNNRWNREEPARVGRLPAPVPERVGEPSVFKHVVYIIKENLSYDSLLGDVPEGRGDASLCMFGGDVSPNQHKIAREFVLLDNAYASGTNSADGHQWTSSSLANAYTEQNYSANARSYPYDGGDPLAYSPTGFLWTSAVRAGKTVRVYGEFVNKPKIAHRKTGKTATWSELWKDYNDKTGAYEIASDTDNAALKPLLHPNYIGFPTTVSDQWRADQFLGDLDMWERDAKMPDLCILLLPNNHTTGTRRGFPTPRAQVADNDLALGRMVDRLSHSRFWGQMLIVVIEDDAQLGLDHLDGHRVPAFCISPYTRRGAVVSDTFDHTSFVRTIGLVLGMPAMNRFDRSATPLTRCFGPSPDLKPFQFAANRIPLDQMNPAPSTLRGESRRLAVASGRLDWSEIDRADPEIVTRAAWVSVFPDRPFPTESYHPVQD